VLSELGLDLESEPSRLLEVWNKADLLDDAALRRAKSEARRAGAVLVSSATGFGLDMLRSAIEQRLNLTRETIEITIKPEEGALSNWIYENCDVVQRSEMGEGTTALRIHIAPDKRQRLAHLAGAARLRLADEQT
jgi:GTP-binding protein HflX